MFCGKCGAQNDDNATICKNCGEPLTADSSTQQKTGGEGFTIGGVTLPVNRNQFIGIAAIAAVAVVVIIILIVNLAGGGAQGVAEKYINATFKADAKTVINLMPKEVVEEMCDREDMDDKKELIDEMKDSLEDMTDDLDDEYDKWSLTAKATRSKDLKKDDIKDIESRHERYYDVDLDVEEAQEVTLEVTAKYDGEKNTEKMKITVIKVDGKWYVDSTSASVGSTGGVFD